MDKLVVGLVVCAVALGLAAGREGDLLTQAVAHVVAAAQAPGR